MNHENVLWVLILFLTILLIIFVVPRFYLYTSEGDIENFYAKDLNRDKSYNKLLEKLYKLSLYDYCKVRWHYLFLLSILASLFVIFLIDSVSLKNFIIVGLIFFLVLTVPTSVDTSHFKSKIANEATLIYSTLKERKH